MSLPINIDNLLTGKVVEWERLEFKRSWDKIEASRAIAAFANDINNWGGGYLIIGIEERDGQPILPPYGIDPNTIDKIQKELLSISNTLKPPYFPLAVPVEFQDKNMGANKRNAPSQSAYQPIKTIPVQLLYPSFF